VQDFKKRRSLRISHQFMTNDFLAAKFPQPSDFSFYRIRIIPVLRPIFAVLSLYHEWWAGLERL